MPPLVYPPALAPGARIAVTAPSSGVPPPLHARLDLVLAHLRAQGWVVEEGACLRAQTRGASAPAAERAAEFERLLLRDDVAAILPPWGGELAIEVLDRLDWPALAAARPKWVMGYSDISTLMVPITLRLGWATAHGINLMDMAPAQQDPLSRDALTLLQRGPGARLEQAQSERWQLHFKDFGPEPEATFQLTEPTHWRALNRGGPVRCSGRLIGGCIDTLRALVGSPHGDIAGWIAAHRGDGTLLYLENCEQTPSELVRTLHQLHWAGWFDGLAGLLFGRSSADTGGVAAESLSYADALHGFAQTLDCPVLAELDIGHRPPQFTLVNGALATVEWAPDGGGSIAQVLPGPAG